MKNKYADLFSSLSKDTSIRKRNDEILLIDGINTFLRSFTMINHVNPLGNHIGGLTGFLKSIGYAIRMINPTRVFIVFDGVGGASNRKNLYPEYKANRHKSRMTNYDIFNSKDEEDESVLIQMERLIQYLQCLPVDMLCIDGLEADDIIGHLTTFYETEETTKKITIMSADRDFLQLVSDKTEVYSPVKKVFYNKNKVLEEFDVSSKNYIMYKVLLGDTGDNIPGVRGLGPKKLIKYFPELQNEDEVTLKEIYTKSEKEEHVMYKKVLERKHQLDINFLLMDLKDVPISKDNIEIIYTVVNNEINPLNSEAFMYMCSEDQLSSSMTMDVSKWLREIFYPLSFK